MKLRTVLLILPLTLLLNGCLIVTDRDRDGDDYSTSDWRTQQLHNRKLITDLTLGTSRVDVQEKMGTPSFSDAFSGKNGSTYQILYYRTHREHSDGETTKGETTPLVFENDKLVGWGNDALQRIH